MMTVVFWIVAQLTYYRKEPWLIPTDDVDLDSDARRIDEEVWDDPDDNPNVSRFDKFWDALI